ncbi:hypothetical protein KVR01_009244 [Diaporthe batatas]|uniref:uncharacterized protein n=1 Tax=Diaporthe batatas TaxID=748121 RepID=UPI001D03D5A4|nr:uncharacterized protein KVR01_009244 [Diaporthe batatas]KAG8160980.1 hypothetical protein KVR01_009244 [Diaporthe batatas]
MKTHVSFLLALSQLAAAGHTLSARVDSEFDCYALDAGQGDEHTLDFNTPLACNEDCRAVNRTIFAVRKSNCLCLDSMPSDDKKVDASKCDEPCPGYMLNACGGGIEYYTGGGLGYYTVGAYGEANYTGSLANPNDTSSADADSSTSQTVLPSASGVPSSSTSSGSSSVATPSGSASGSSASPSSTVESTNAAAPIFDASLTVVSSLVGAVALLGTLI